MEVVNSADFLRCDPVILQHLLKERELNIDSELQLIAACERWAAQRVDDNTSALTVLTPARQYLRFLTLSPAQFAEVCSSNYIKITNLSL